MAPRIIDKIAKRDEILQSALRTFARHGFKNTKMIHIADEAGIGKGTIYEYFRNKDEMLLAGFADYIMLAETEINQILKTQLPPVDKIRDLIRRLLAVYEQDPNLTRVFFDFWVEGMQNEDQPEIDFKPIYANLRQTLQQLLAEAQAVSQIRQNISEHTASVLLGMIEGIFLQWIVDPEIYSLSDTVDGVIDTVFNGILAGTE